MSQFEDNREPASSHDPMGGTATQVAYGQPRQPMHMQQQQQYPYGWEMRPRRVYPIETKPFFLTSEFAGALAAIAGIAITAASSDAFGAWRAWILITAITVGYLISRGIAKSGTRSHADDPREHFDLNFGRHNHGRGHSHDGHTHVDH